MSGKILPVSKIHLVNGTKTLITGFTEILITFELTDYCCRVVKMVTIFNSGKALKDGQPQQALRS